MFIQEMVWSQLLVAISGMAWWPLHLSFHNQTGSDNGWMAVQCMLLLAPKIEDDDIKMTNSIIYKE